MKFTFYNKGYLRFELTDDILVDNIGLGFIGQLLSQADFNLTVNGDSVTHGSDKSEYSGSRQENPAESLVATQQGVHPLRY